MVVGSNPVAVTSPSDFAPASSKEFLDIQATIECGFTLKHVRDMIKTYSQTPTDLAKLTNAVEHDVVKKTDYNAKATSIEAQIAGLTKNTVDNLADITKLKAIDTNSFVTRTKFSADTNALDDKIDGVEKKNT